MVNFSPKYFLIFLHHLGNILSRFFYLEVSFLGFFISTLFILFELFNLLKKRTLEFTGIKMKIRFTLYSYANRLSGVFFRWGDKLVIGAIFGFSVLGSYHFAAQYLVLLEIIPRSMQQYLLPQESVGKNIKKMKIFSILISCLVALISISVVPYGIDTFLPNYHESILPIQIMSIGIIPLAISAIQNTEFLAKENSRIVLIGAILQSVLYIILVIVLGQIWGLFGFAVGFLSAITVRMVFNLIVRFTYQRQNQPKI